MSKKLNTTLKFGNIALILIFSGCASTAPSENESNPAAGETPAISAVPPTVQALPPSPAKASIEIKRSEDIKITSLEMQKFTYELGFDPKKEITPDQKQQIIDRKKLRQLERSLDSQKERLQYSKVLAWLSNDLEKIELLSIPSIEGRQVWINKNKIWSRVKDLKNFDEIVESQDIALGMPQDYVRKSWGEPSQIEISGNAIYKNERWQYLKQISTPQGYKQQSRLVYFEGGRVVGWETE